MERQEFLERRKRLRSDLSKIDTAVSSINLIFLFGFVHMTMLVEKLTEKSPVGKLIFAPPNFALFRSCSKEE